MRKKEEKKMNREQEEWKMKIHPRINFHKSLLIPFITFYGKI